jgi:hypothetical protein
MSAFDIFSGGANRSSRPWVFASGANREVKQVYVFSGGANRLAFVNVTVTLSDASVSASGAVDNHGFTVSVTVTGGTPTAFSWGYSATNHGTWTISAGQGTASCTATVSAMSTHTANASLYCDVTVGGNVYRTAICALSYTDTAIA